MMLLKVFVILPPPRSSVPPVIVMVLAPRVPLPERVSVPLETVVTPV